MSVRGARLAWYGLCAAVLVALAAALWHEPVLRDGWAFEFRGAPGLSVGAVVDYARWAHAQSNPRLGEIFDFIVHTGAPVGALLTPLVVLATLVALFVLAHARWPRPGEAGEAWRLLVIVGLFWAGVPFVGQVVGHRPIATNYVYGFALQLWFVAPWRLVAGEARATAAKSVAMLAVGVVAGLCLEHTGPALIAALSLASWQARRERRARAWMVTGLVGFALGWVWLITAPGQDVRYQGLASQDTLVGRVLARGAGENALVVGKFVLGAIVPLCLAAWGVVSARGARRAPLVALGTALAIVLTQLASPKQGWRLYYPGALVAIVAAAMALERVRGGGARRGIAAIAAIVWLGATVMLGRVEIAAGREVAARRRLLAAAAPGTVAVVPPLSGALYRPSWWFIGDDFRAAPLRARVAANKYGLAGIELGASAGRDPTP